MTVKLAAKTFAVTTLAYVQYVLPFRTFHLLTKVGVRNLRLGKVYAYCTYIRMYSVLPTYCPYYSLLGSSCHPYLKT